MRQDEEDLGWTGVAGTPSVGEGCPWDMLSTGGRHPYPPTSHRHVSSSLISSTLLLPIPG